MSQQVSDVIPTTLGELIADLQAVGMRTRSEVERRVGGAGPTDVGMFWVEGIGVTIPTTSNEAKHSPYSLEVEDEGTAIYRDGVRLASAHGERRPKFYDLETADGVPYWQIALLHLDSLASTVVQHCSYWGNADQCGFCGIGLSLDSGRTIVKKSPAQLAEVAVAARDLDGAVDATLTTGSSNGRDRGALYVAKCGQAVKEAAGLPVEVQFEPPFDLDVINQVGGMGIDSVGIHIETFDPAVLARVAPGKFRTGMERYFEAWERAVSVFGSGQVSTYVILGMGEDPELTIEGCKRAVDIGVYPFIVPIRPVVGSLLEDIVPPTSDYTEPIYRKVATYMAERGMDASQVSAGCARCQACSAINSMKTDTPLVLLGPTRTAESA